MCLTFNLPVQAQDSTISSPSLARVTFTAEQTPNPHLNNILAGMSADSENDIWVVGTAAPGAIGLRFDGSTWSSVPMELPNTASMSGVSVLAPNDVWAVGDVFNVGQQHFSSVIQHFDGTKWSLVPGPHFKDGDRLFGVKAIASNDVFAGGESRSDSQKPLPLIEHFDGVQWAVIPAPALPKGQRLSLHNIAATSHSDVWVTGIGTGSQPPAIMHFDGQQFSNVPFPSAPQAFLSGLTTIAADDAWVVGGQAGGTLTAHWDGTVWTIVPSPNVPNTGSLLGAVSASSTTDAWAVGCAPCGADAGVGQTILVEHWNGKRWTIHPTPLIGQGDNPASILVFPSGSVFVAGTSAGPILPFQTLVLHATEGR
jgi:hypothetical protein